jgi:hypothetical protein
MTCLKRLDYLLILGEIFISVGLATIVYARSEALFLPLAIVSAPLILFLVFLTSAKRLRKPYPAITIASSVSLSTPLIIIAANLLQSYAKEGYYRSPFVYELLDKMRESFLAASLALIAIFSLSSYLLIKALLTPDLEALKLEGGMALAEEYLAMPSHRLACLMIPLGFLLSYFIKPPPLTLTVLPFIMLAPLPLQASAAMGLLLSFLGISVDPAFLAVTLVMYVTFWKKLWGVKTAGSASLIISAGVYLLASLLCFFILFGAEFPVYMATSTLLILLAGYLMLGIEAKGAALSPYTLLLLSQLFASEPLPVSAEPLFPLLLAATPIVLSAFYIEKFLKHFDEECGTTIVQGLLVILPLVLAPLLYSNATIELPSFHASANHSLLCYVVPLASLLISILQQVAVRGRIPGRVEPLLLFSLHPIGLAIAILVPKGELLPLLFLATILIIVRMIFSKHSEVYRELSCLFILGYSIGAMFTLLYWR